MRPAVGCGVDEREPDAPPPDAGTELPARLGTPVLSAVLSGVPCAAAALVLRSAAYLQP